MFVGLHHHLHWDEPVVELELSLSDGSTGPVRWTMQERLSTLLSVVALAAATLE